MQTIPFAVRPGQKRAARAMLAASIAFLLVAGLSASPAGASSAPRPSAGSRSVLQQVAGASDVAIVARLRNRSAVPSVSSLAKVHGGHVRHVLSQLNLVTFEAPRSRSVEVQDALADSSSVSSVGAVSSRRLSYLPNDANYDQEASYLSAVSAPAAWDVSKGDPSVTIAIVDTGIDTTHPD